MALEAIIERFEAGTPEDDDFGHPLAREIVEELAECRESEQQRALFADVRMVADHLIEQYLRLDREDKLKMADVYQEECFKRLGGLNSSTKERLIKELGNNHLNLLLKISNYSKLLPILERYVAYVEENKWPNSRHSSLTYYLLSHDFDGRKVKMPPRGAMESLYVYDFRNNTTLRKKDKHEVLDSLTHGVPDGLRQLVINAASLLSQRIKILENYLNYLRNLEENDELSLTNSGLTYYLRHHDVNGNRVKTRKESLDAYYGYDFRTNQKLKRRSELSTVESMTAMVPDELRQKVVDLQNCLPLRIKILEDYVKYVQENMDLSMKNSTLQSYLHYHTILGKKVKKGSKRSMTNLARYSFRRRVQLRSSNSDSAFENIVYGVPDELKQRVIDANSLLPQRIIILENYLQCFEDDPNLDGYNFTLAYYLLNYTIDGNKVPSQNKGSLKRYHYDFMKHRPLKRKSLEALLKSMTYRVPEELRKRVYDAASSLPQRIQIFRNYVRYVEENTNLTLRYLKLSYYLGGHNISGEKVERDSSESLRRFSTHDHKTHLPLNSRDSRRVLEAMLHDVPDELQLQVMDAASLLPQRIKILIAYINYVEGSDGLSVNERSLHYYLTNYNHEGKRVSDYSSTSLTSFCQYDFKNMGKYKKRGKEALVESMVSRISDQSLVAKVRRYALAA